MYKQIFLFSLFILFSTTLVQSQTIDLSQGWKFKTGDSLLWSKNDFDDSQWRTINVGMYWEAQGVSDYDGYAWYRLKIVLPSTLISNSLWKDSLEINLGWIDECSETFLNGELLGKMDHYRKYVSFKIDVKNKIIRWDKENVIAIRVLDRFRKGGLYHGPYTIGMYDITKLIYFDKSGLLPMVANNQISGKIKIFNRSKSETISGTIKTMYYDIKKDVVIKEISEILYILKDSSSLYSYSFEHKTDDSGIRIFFTPKGTKNSIVYDVEVPYIWTPATSDSVRINGGTVLGNKYGNPFLYKIPATGKQPIVFKVNGLPDGLTIDENTGIITGILKERGETKMQVIAKNDFSEARKTIEIKVANTLCLTPPMGWASWNVWGKQRISDKIVRETADKMVELNLNNYGYQYINIDDGWEGNRNANGEILTNEKFPDMNSLTDYLHAKGFKAGIYSSPGPKTCGSLEGSYQHELLDAKTFGKWGFDFLKYDLCSYSKVVNIKTLEDMILPYRLMGQCLDSVNRDIVYSICQYGEMSPWEWADKIGGNLWRTTSDLEDTWYSLSNIGYVQNPYSKYAKPGHWNDPDMLVIGTLGYGISPTMHYTQLTPSEQYTHISLWSLLAAPMLIGCDLAQMDPFTYSLLTNVELIDINQDKLGKQAELLQRTDTYDIWAKVCSDGSYAVGLFNKTEKIMNITFDFSLLKLSGKQKIRNVWRQKEEGVFQNKFSAEVKRHGAVVYKIRK